MSMTTLTLHGTQTQSQSPLHRIMRFTMMILLLMEKDMIQAMTLVIRCNLIVIIMVCIILRLTWRMCSMVYLALWLAGANFRVSFQISSRYSLLQMFHFLGLQRMVIPSWTPPFTYPVPHHSLSPVDQVGLIMVFTRMYWRLSLLTGCRIVLLQPACSALLLSLHLLVEDIIVGFVEDFSAEHVPRGGVCYLLI